MYQKYIKRLLDIILSLIAIIITLPIFLITGILVLIFLGKPAIFRQKRPGKKEKIFTMYKFRTMSNKKDKDGNLLPDELRLTKLGKFLRKTSFDELPQLLNIIKGELSIIGPRPVIAEELEKYGINKEKFLSVTPGLTGYWAANGRSTTTYEQRMEMELYYVDNMSFKLDLKIFFKTILSVMKKEGAI